MKLNLKQLIGVLLSIGLMASVAKAQVDIGMPPFGSFGGGPFDSVNLGNLNVHFAIPVVHKAGRGLAFDYNLAYDGSIWQPVTSNGTTSWTKITSTNWGWTSSMRGGGQAYAQNVLVDQEPCIFHGVNKTETTTTYNGWTYFDAFGTPHKFFGQSMTQTGCTTLTTGFGPRVATDGSGYQITVSGGTITSLTAADGAKISPATGSNTFQDANGNKITSSTSNGTATYTDTLGVAVLSVSGSGSPTDPVLLQYNGPGGTTPHYTVQYTSYTVNTNFGVGTIQEYGPTTNSLVSSIQLPDGTGYSFTYETTPGSCTPNPGTFPSCITGRIASVTLPTGGTVTYVYTGGTNNTGIFSDGSTAGLKRILAATTTCTPNSTTAPCWQYSRTLVSGTPGTGSTWTTTVVDPNGNNTVLNLAEDSATGTGATATYNLYETQRKVYQGSTSGTLLGTRIICYNANYTSCATATVTSPITETDTYSQLPNLSTNLSQTLYSSSGLVTDRKEYDYGVALGSAPTTAHRVRGTAITYASLGNAISNKPATVVVSDWTTGSAVTLASSTYTYDGTSPTPTSGTPQHASVTGSRGNVTTLSMTAHGTTSLTRTFSYFDTGNVNVATDVNGAQATYIFGTTPQGSSTISCGNSFPTTVQEPLSLSRSLVWDCNGGLSTQVTDENGKNVTSSYTDLNFWRPATVTDPMNNQTNLTYIGQTAVDAALQNFNGGSSASDSRGTADGFGRAILGQRLQAPNGTNYDTVETDYNNVGLVQRTTMPFSATAGATSSTAPATIRTYDAFGRLLTVTDQNGGQVSYTYTNNDVLQQVSGTQTFQKQFEYDGLGRLASVCEMTQATGSGTCGQSNQVNGFWTKYTYDALGHLITVKQNAQAVTSSQQTRSFTYDLLGRITSQSNPETGNNGVNGTISYSYDSVTPCGDGNNYNSGGDLVQKTDSAGNVTCYAHDALHRVTQEGNSTITNATIHKFFYDSKASYPSGVTVVNGKTRLIEAQTLNTSNAVITDEFFSYSPRGELTDVYESTPHSGGFYHTTAAYWPTGVLKTLSGIPSVPTINYGANGIGLDGEGRVTQVTASSGPNPVTGVTYSASSSTNFLGALTGVTFGSLDSDSFTYDSNTGRILTYAFNVNSKADSGTLTWNTNGTLSRLVVNDQITSTTDSQTCNYSYDDLARISSASCGTLWSQTFSYDSFGNVSKSGNSSFLPNYTFSNSAITNQFFSIPGVSVSYDGNGNLLTDNLNTYMWDPNWGKMLNVSNGAGSVTATYDALGRMVEQQRGSSFTQILYSPIGKTALMNGQALTKAFVHLPGGATAVYTSAGLTYYRHSDWLGSSRLSSTQARALYSGSAYAPFGEQYATSGTADASFTGQNSDTMSNLYDFTFRQHSPSQGRWISPDPAGLLAVDPASPQSWNRYAYVGNNPLSLIDPLGAVQACPPGSGVGSVNPDGTTNCGSAGGDAGGGEGGGGIPIAPLLPPVVEGGGGGGPNLPPLNPVMPICGTQCQLGQLFVDFNPPMPTGPSEDCVTGALEEVIKAGEGTSGNNGYGLLVYGTVQSAPGFPNLVGRTGSPRRPIVIDPNTLSGFPSIAVQTPYGISHAFGAFQFMPGTWSYYGGGTDVSPSAQDDVAATAIQNLGALGAAMSGNFQGAMRDLNRTWASLPGSPYNQPTMTMNQAHDIFEHALNTLPECN